MQNPRGKTILVTGATGHQGGAAARHLINDGWTVRALTRDPEKPAARALRELGAEVVKGDLLNRASLKEAVKGAYGVYSVETAMDAGFEAEEVEGKNLADVAAAEGVEHFVYDSHFDAGSETGPGWVVAKHHIEEHIRKLGLRATVWRPVTFMENFMRQKEDILHGKLRSPRWPESLGYFIAVDDIGRFVALAFHEPERFVGTTMTIAGDAMTMEEVAQTFSRVLGTHVEFEHVETEGAQAPPRPAPGEAQRQVADLEACRRLIPDLVTLQEWVEAAGWRTPVAR